jgi:diguanylate cyclase (GGDEF)-like protein
LVAGCLLCVFALDHATGATPVQHLYYVPIVLAGISFGMSGGVTAALAAVTLYHLANPHLLTFRYEEPDLVQIALFLAVGVISARLAADRDRLRGLAMTDDLTGLHNLRSFEARLQQLVRTSRREQTPLSVLVLDVDRLKSLNDQHGHLTGAEAVRAIGHIITRELPPESVACRYGGDEFVIAIPRCTAFRMRRVADDLRRAVHDCAPCLPGTGSRPARCQSAAAWRAPPSTAVRSSRCQRTRMSSAENCCFAKRTPPSTGRRLPVATRSALRDEPVLFRPRGLSCR